MPFDQRSVQDSARRLLDALERMHGAQSLSFNVRTAQDDLRRLLPVHRDPRDATEEKAQV